VEIRQQAVKGFFVGLGGKTVGVGQMDKGLGGSGVEIKKFQKSARSFLFWVTREKGRPADPPDGQEERIRP
jgi:hypothetical protein